MENGHLATRIELKHRQQDYAVSVAERADGGWSWCYEVDDVLVITLGEPARDSRAALDAAIGSAIRYIDCILQPPY